MMMMTMMLMIVVDCDGYADYDGNKVVVMVRRINMRVMMLMMQVGL